MGVNYVGDEYDAVGDVAVGGVAVGGVAVGDVAVGDVAVGVIAVGDFAIGVNAVGAFALGAVAANVLVRVLFLRKVDVNGQKPSRRNKTKVYNCGRTERKKFCGQEYRTVGLQNLRNKYNELV